MKPPESRTLANKLRKLDKVRTRLAELGQLDEQLAGECVTLMRQHQLDTFNFSTQRSVALTQKVSSSVTPEAFYDAARAANLSPPQIHECVRESVLIGRARELLGDERLDAIATKKPGKYELRFSGGAARARKAG